MPGHVTERDVTHVNVYTVSSNPFILLSMLVPTSALTKSIQDSINVLGRRGRIENRERSVLLQYAKEVK